MFKSESIVYKLLREFYGETAEIHINYRPDWLKNPNTGFNLEVDFYIPSRSVAYEVQGTHHYQKKDKGQQWRDKYKKKICDSKGITLVTVTADQRDFYALRNLLKLNIPDADIHYNFKMKNNPKYPKPRKGRGNPNQKKNKKYVKIVSAYAAQRKETESVLRRRKEAGVWHQRLCVDPSEVLMGEQ